MKIVALSSLESPIRPAAAMPPDAINHNNNPFHHHDHNNSTAAAQGVTTAAMNISSLDEPATKRLKQDGNERGGQATTTTTTGTTTESTTPLGCTSTTTDPDDYAAIRSDTSNNKPAWRLETKESYSDLTIKVLVVHDDFDGGGSSKRHDAAQQPRTSSIYYHVHKVHLLTGEHKSEYFANMLKDGVDTMQTDSRGNVKNSQHPYSCNGRQVIEVTLHEEAAKLFPVLLDFLYTGVLVLRDGVGFGIVNSCNSRSSANNASMTADSSGAGYCNAAAAVPAATASATGGGATSCAAAPPVLTPTAPASLVILTAKMGVLLLHLSDYFGVSSLMNEMKKYLWIHLRRETILECLPYIIQYQNGMAMKTIYIDAESLIVDAVFDQERPSSHLKQLASHMDIAFLKRVLKRCHQLIRGRNIVIRTEEASPSVLVYYFLLSQLSKKSEIRRGNNHKEQLHNTLSVKDYEDITSERLLPHIAPEIALKMLDIEAEILGGKTSEDDDLTSLQKRCFSVLTKFKTHNSNAAEAERIFSRLSKLTLAKLCAMSITRTNDNVWSNSGANYYNNDVSNSFTAYCPSSASSSGTSSSSLYQSHPGPHHIWVASKSRRVSGFYKQVDIEGSDGICYKKIPSASATFGSVGGAANVHDLGKSPYYEEYGIGRHGDRWYIRIRSPGAHKWKRLYSNTIRGSAVLPSWGWRCRSNRWDPLFIYFYKGNLKETPE